MQLVQTDEERGQSDNLIGSVEAEAVPDGLGPPAGRHDEVRPAEADAAAGSPGAVLQAGGLGRQRADVAQVARGHGAAARAARGDVAVQHLAVHHGLLALLVASKNSSDTHFKVSGYCEQLKTV